MTNLVRVGIAGTGHSVPPRVVTNDDLSKIVDTNDEWITKRTGIKARRFVDDGTDCSHLCGEAARQAIEAAGLKPEDIDLIIVDPPYLFDKWDELFSALPPALVVVESGEELNTGSRWSMLRSRRYGGSVVMFLEPSADHHDPQREATI